MIEIKNVDIKFFRKVLEFDDKTYAFFFDFVSDILDLKENITNDDFSVFKYSFLNPFIDNKYSFEGIDDTFNKLSGNNYKIALLKMISYLHYLEINGEIDLHKEIDIIKYYGKSENVPKEIYPYMNDSNPVMLGSVISYLQHLISPFHITYIDNIAPLIIQENVILSDKDIEIHYDKLLEKFKEMCIKYSDVIKELESNNLKESFFKYYNKYEFHKMIKYLKVNYSKKNKIYDVLKKAEELHIHWLQIYDECQQDKDVYEEIKVSKFGRARKYDEYIENGYAGTYIYTDGIKKWLIEKKHNSEMDCDHIYTVKIKDANYILFNYKIIDWKEFFEPALSITSKLKIYNFDIDTKTFPSYEELISFKIAPQVDFDSVKNKTDAVNSLLQVEGITKDINKLINNLEQLYNKLESIKNYSEYLEVLSDINNLKNLLEKMKKVEPILCNDYSEKGIIELEDIEKLKVLRK